MHLASRRHFSRGYRAQQSAPTFRVCWEIIKASRQGPFGASWCNIAPSTAQMDQDLQLSLFAAA